MAYGINNTSASLRKFHFRFALHIVNISMGTFLLSSVIIFLAWYGTWYFFMGAVMLEIFDEISFHYYMYAFLCLLILLFGIILFISSIVSVVFYAKETIHPFARQYFRVMNEPFPFEKKKSTSQKPPIPQGLSTQPALRKSSSSQLQNTYDESAERSRWGPK